jgi:hypothetical protein
MWYKIKEGRHRAYPLSLGIHFGKTSESYEVIFDDSCRYTLEGVDQEDTNKLFGWSYGLHRNNSIRCGWEYVPEVDKIKLTLYVYESEIRIEKEINQLYDINEKIRLELLYKANRIILMSGNYEEKFGMKFIESSMKSIWGYKLGVYFGGNKTAPKDMKIWIKKLKTS